MPYSTPVTEQLFVLEHIAGSAELAAHDRFAAATPDVVKAIVEGAGEFAEAECAPLARSGDVEGARWINGKVVLPSGYRETYKAFVCTGWGAERAG